MKILKNLPELKSALQTPRRSNQNIALVPTLGALHEGHQALIRKARLKCDCLIVSIFVNPLQFGPGEDLKRYPRTWAKDLKRCRRWGVDFVFAPNTRSVFKSKSLKRHRATFAHTLCGPFRPGHFDGVVSIVAYLFRIIRPQLAYFGLKDYQQYRVVEDMAKRLFPHIRIVPVNTVRNSNGLALSSRNRYLNPRQKHTARELIRTLRWGSRELRRGVRDTNRLQKTMKARIVRKTQCEMKVQYLDIVDACTLRPVKRRIPIKRRQLLLAAAVHLGPARLIDNVLV